MPAPDPFTPLPSLPRRPPPGRPLMGVRLLLVEDSRFASDAVRLMCLRSGARMRRADSLAAARRHLAVYRPTVALIDLGLPDGSGAALLADLAGGDVPGLLATSGDPGREAEALAAGASAFLAKPLESLAAFQQAVCACLPAGLRPKGPRALIGEPIVPDRLALRDDLNHAADLLEGAGDVASRNYLAQFLHGLATSAHDAQLDAAAAKLVQAGETGVRHSLRALLEDRVASSAAIG